MDEPETWRWIWLGAALFFALGEMASPGSFFLAPFAIGAVVAATFAFAELSLVAQWGAFVGVSLASFLALRPLARRLDASGTTEGVGSRRLIGRVGVVLEDVGPGLTGFVRIDAEEWRASAQPAHLTLPAGTEVVVSDMEGTRVIVTATDKEPSS
jgi:membrane protein implicated in regulation of membrane protease activity